MESKYDRKFEEMKKYIPFLENMINRLESNSSASANPRQAQLDKIRSLRDLLLDKKKRMKMENLLKCEQVLVNLYAKVEQRDTFSNLKSDQTMDSPNKKEKTDLEIVRNKLKTVAKLQEDADTLPEIARANDVEQYCSPGSKEPALFQRRPNMPENQVPKSHVFENNPISPQAQPKRNYTRVLVSPERSPRPWSTPEESSSKPLFSRRSPARSKSPSLTKKEKKKSKSSKSRKSKDSYNITLNVPKESLNSLNTKDIFSRIITCSDADVDISTLSELRSQILGELKQTVKNNDISDLILKSYDKKTKNKKSKRKSKEVEEGELSDSESEAIESIYGSLVPVDKDKKTIIKTTEDKSNHSSKIQICLVINSEKEDNRTNILSSKGKVTEFEIQSESEEGKEVISIDSDTPSLPQTTDSPTKTRPSTLLNIESSLEEKNITLHSPVKNQPSDIKKLNSPTNQTQPSEIIAIEEVDKKQLIDEQTTNHPDLKTFNDSAILADTEPINKTENDIPMERSSPRKKELHSSIKKVIQESHIEDPPSSEIGTEQNKNFAKTGENLDKPAKFIANFYKPLEDHQDPSEKSERAHTLETDTFENSADISSPTSESLDTKKSRITIESDKDSKHIPLLNEPTLPPQAKKDVLSEIDILQALKNEILSDKIAVPVSETVTPALHIPKLTKVANAQEVAHKKRISIEKYKEKSTASKPLFFKQHNNRRLLRDDHKKQSLKLTEKECERFNLPKRVSLEDDSVYTSDEDLFLNSDQENSLGLDDVYGDLAPKSPDHEISSESSAPPVIIPVDPIKTNTVSCKSDVDMRNLLPLLSPPPQPIPSSVIPPSPLYNNNIEKRHSSESNIDGTQKNSERSRFNAKDPRMRRDLNSAVRDSPNPHLALNPDNSAVFPNMTPSYMPSMTPNARSFEMTPSHQSFESENFSTNKHVYAPSFSSGENRERELSAARDNWDISKNDLKSGCRSRWDRESHPLDPPVIPYYEDSYKYNNRSRNEQIYRDNRDGGYSRADCPTTPMPSFGWSECPSTPAGSFGRQDPSMTPSHSFSRSEYPITPSHPFGRSDCPSTPVHPFGRNDGSSTPNHPFGRSNATSFGRDGLNNSNTSKYSKDPRFYTRQRDYESSSYSDKDRNVENERSYYRGGSYRTQNKAYNGIDSFKQDSDRSRGFYSTDNMRHYDRDRELSDCSSLSKDSDNDRLYTRNREKGFNDGRYSRNDDMDSRRHQRDRSIGRQSEFHSSGREHSDRARSMSRAPSVDISSNKDRHNDNTLSFKSDTGRSLTIDTSVKSTFQDFFDKPIQVFDHTFDARKQRAASVGRSLVRENSVGRILGSHIRTIDTFDNDKHKKDDRFKRACSMGRELIKNNENERSLKDLKADFESFKSKLKLENNRDDKCKRASSMGRELVRENSEYRIKDLKADFESFTSKLKLDTVAQNEIIKTQKQSTPRSRKDMLKRQDLQSNQTSKLQKQYFPRKNYRDPRMCKESYRDYQSRFKIDRRGSNSRNAGIVYSSDNIAKGTIMGSGFGVKNYRIPKLKRAPVENVPDNMKDKNITSKQNQIKENEGVQVSQIDKKLDKNEEVIKSIEKTVNEFKINDSQIEHNNIMDNSEKRVTRSRAKLVSPQIKEDATVLLRTRRSKKAVILDSDSDSHTENHTEIIKKAINSSGKSPSKKIIRKESVSPVAQKETDNNINEEILDPGFGIDDIEIFSENIGDSVIDNINALIADLDNDIGTSKIVGGDFNAEIEKMIESIDNPEDNNFSGMPENNFSNSSDQFKNNLVCNNVLRPSDSPPTDITHQKCDIIGQPHMHVDNSCSTNKHMDILKDKDKEVIVEKGTTYKSNDKNLNDFVATTRDDTINESIVSTTEIDQDLRKSKDNIQGISMDDDESVPDSTISKCGVTEKSKEVITDITNEIHCELSSDVTSTHDLREASKKDMEISSSIQIDSSSLNSIGHLLSILQDKSKIKELLAVLGDKSSENEKIKKKLERLSEIVSDEDDNDANEEQSITSKLNKESFDRNTEENLEQCNKSMIKYNEKNIVQQINISCEEPKTENINKISEDKLDIKNKEDTSLLLMNSKHVDNITKKIDEQMHNTLTNKNVKESIVSLNVEKSEAEKSKCNIEKHNKNDEVEDTNKIEDEEQNDAHEKSISITKRKISKKIKPKRNTRFKKSAPNKIKSQSVPSSVQIKKRSNRSELKKLQDDIKEMFMSEDILNSTGIRMCRLAKMVHGKEENKKEDSQVTEPVLSKNVKGFGISDETPDKFPKKSGPKTRSKITNVQQKSPDLKVSELDSKVNKLKPLKRKPGPKSKTKPKGADIDPYEFETDSITDTNTTKESEESSSDSESDSLASSQSIGSSEVLAEAKKKIKRKRFAWKSGVIKPKNKKKKDQKQTDNLTNEIVPSKIIPDFNCFTDKSYCFDKGISSYRCRLCEFIGEDIVNHYKKQHPHTEIPLSRMNPKTAEIAIKQCEEINFQAISKIPSKKYICRFCHKEFGRNKAALELFFWHVVSNHTGEYKHLCSDCVNVTRCPFNLDIPPPPKDIKGQLIGYICGKCNFTQISLENLKTHVIVRHNDEQTEVYTINLAKLSKKAMKVMLSNNDLTESPRVLRNQSLRSNCSNTETSENRDDRSEAESSERISEADTLPLVAEKLPRLEVPKIEPDAIKSKLTFENDEPSDDTSVKIEQEDHETDDRDDHSHFEGVFPEPADDNPVHEPVMEPELTPEVARNSNDIMDYPHFKLNQLESGAKEYVCCINGNDNHYKTSLLISMKKHIQSKHSEKWDGYCCLCKVIVTLQGIQSDFRDCLSHFMDKHMDEFPTLEKPAEIINTENPPLPIPERIMTPPARTASPGYLAVRPIAELISKELVKEIATPPEKDPIPFPKIENVVSLGVSDTLPPTKCSPVYPCTSSELEPLPQKPFLYEEFQAEVMSKKHRVVLDAMMSKNKLVRVFKCAGRFCSFTSDSADAALVHASTHQRIGGEGALNCAYCNFDACENAIDLVMHVFKVHSQCQYTCALCFYRAAASQLVGAHHKRVHSASAPINVLRTTGTAVPPDLNSANNVMLLREQAVQHFICYHDGGNCNYKTFTPGKFIEHLTQKHNSVSNHPCYLCQNTSTTPQELINHMKTHGINMYQCTWCVHGAENEASLLSHVASCHPSRQPQAYIRVITNKDGYTQQRVLPLAVFNKATLPQEDVSPSKGNENPVREAERSIELEKLIGLTSKMIENADNAVNNQTTNQSTESPLESSDIIKPQVPASLTSQQVPQETLIKKEPAELEKLLSNTSVICLDSDEDESIVPLNNTQTEDPIAEPPSNITSEDANKITNEETISASDTAVENVILKKVDMPRRSVTEDVTITKISEDTLRKSVSDDDSRHAIIELSDEESSKRATKLLVANKVRMEALLICPKCKMLCKSNQGLKKHMNRCCGDIIDLPCPHAPCSVMIYSFSQMVEHFNMVHVERDQYLCGVCNASFNTLGGTKLHVRSTHRVTPYVASTKKTEGVGHVTTVGALPNKPSQSLLRPEQKKYGVADADSLPIAPILDSPVQCELCGFSTKVRLNMVRHLRLHAGSLPAPCTQPVNPVPHLETNEMHFDRMVNLASSSAGERLVPTRYPCHVPERRRFACGAPACSYISVDEATLRRHWEALHVGAAAFRCVHCPPDQRIDSSKPLSAARIMAHLKMHDESLYACSACPFYHCKARMVERHSSEQHRGSARVVVVREQGTVPAPPAPPPVALTVPTMDLKPWQCGLCEFKSMLRPAVIEHCAATHQSKMQFKCAYCPFRTSARENVTKHQTNSHPARVEEIVHYYYREGSIPDNADGIPRWKKQRQILGLPELQIKEESEPTAPVPDVPATVTVDLNLVKKEVDEHSVLDLSVEDLCVKFGKFCEPNGIKYKCCLCTAITTQTREEMQAHLYEELHYRRLGCGLCSYKAFHKAGLNEHTASEHPRQFVPPTELPVDGHIEKWVANALGHQTTIIEKNKLNFAAQAIQIEKSPTVVAPKNVESFKSTANTSDAELEHAFGKFGEAKGQHFSCPKCDFLAKDETGMRNHLENELTKIRWCCTECMSKFTTYHEAQFHCKSAHPSGLARPKEAIRDPNVRAKWVSAVVDTQKRSLHSDPEPYLPEMNLLEVDDSLLVPRYDEPAPIEPVHLIPQNNRSTSSVDSDDNDRLVIDEPPKKKPAEKKCQYCDYTTATHRCWREHIIVKHYNMKPYQCSLCSYVGNRAPVLNHMEKRHSNEVHRVISIKIPNYPPPGFDATLKKTETDDGKKVCLYCEKSVPEIEINTHVHDNEKPEFAKRAEVVFKCLQCLELRLSLTGMQQHFASCHPNDKLAYALFKLQVDLREIHCCGHCYRKFKNLGHLREHHTAMHSPLPVAYTSIPFNRNLRTECDSYAGKRKLEDGVGPPAKRIARKSTSKLPKLSLAKKSTTKLPYVMPDICEYTFYGSKPPPLHNYEKLTLQIPNSNSITDVKRLSGIVKIDPKVVVSDCKR